MDSATGGPTSSDLPVVSVILPAYNGERTLAWTLESLAAQDYPMTEWILVDDASTDGTAGILGMFARQKGTGAAVVRHDSNWGLSRTLNDGLSRAGGSLVLILHQDIQLLGSDWIARATARILRDEATAVVTCYYGLPAPDDLTFVKRGFGFLRRQFHRLPDRQEEEVPFTEFKSDLVRKSALDSLEGFPTDYRVCGEDIVVSYRIRQAGGRIVKVYGLRSIQRFSGTSETLVGNLHKEFGFGQSIAGVLLEFRGYSFRDLEASSYARTRSLHRASQPIFAVAVAAVALWAAGFPSVAALGLLLLLLLGRYSFYVARLWPEFRTALPRRTVAAFETLGAGFLGLASDFVYSIGIAAGFARRAYGGSL